MSVCVESQPRDDLARNFIYKFVETVKRRIQYELIESRAFQLVQALEDFVARRD